MVIANFHYFKVILRDLVELVSDELWHPIIIKLILLLCCVCTAKNKTLQYISLFFLYSYKAAKPDLCMVSLHPTLLSGKASAK